MTTRWKRLTALLLVLLTLLNAGSALAAEEFWKWGDEFQQWEAWEGQVGVLSTQVYKDELYFVYGRLLLKCHDPESKPEEVMQLKKLLPEDEQPYYTEKNYYGHIVLTAFLFTDGDALYIFAQGMHKVFRIDFVDGEATPVLCAELDFDDVEGVDRESTDGSERVFKPYYSYGRIAKIGEKIYMWGIYGTVKKTEHGIFCFSLKTGKGKLIMPTNISMQIVSWQENPEWASTLLIYCNDEEWKQDNEGQGYAIDKRVLAAYNPEEFKQEKTILQIKDLGLENQLSYDLDWGFYIYDRSCRAFAWDAENRRIFFIHDDVAWYTDGENPARGFDYTSMDARFVYYGFFWKGYYYFACSDGVFVCDMSRVPQSAQ